MEKGNFDALRIKLSKFRDDFLSTHNTNNLIDNMWQDIKQAITAAINKHIPSKMSTTRYSQPWVNIQVRRMSRRKKKLFKIAKRTNDENVWRRFRELRKRAHKQCKIAYDQGRWNIGGKGGNCPPSKSKGGVEYTFCLP
jgi:hypothetical protein